MAASRLARKPPLLFTESNGTFGVRAELGAYFHERVQNAYFIDGGIFFRQMLHRGIYAEGGSGLGYSHTFYPADQYEQGEDGNFYQIDRRSRGHLIITADLGLGYQLSPHWAVFTRYQFMLETSFTNEFPSGPHTLFSIGGKYFLFPAALDSNN